MSLLNDGAFMAQFEQSKVEVQQQMNIMIEGIYAKVLLNLVQWLNKDDRNDSSIYKPSPNYNDDTGGPVELTFPNPMSTLENVNNLHSPPSAEHYQIEDESRLNVFAIKREIDSDCEDNVTDNNNNLPSESLVLQSTSSESLQPTHSISPSSFTNEVVSHNEIDDDVEFPNAENNEYRDYDEVSNRFPISSFTQQPIEGNEKQMHFEEDDYDQELLDEVKREIEEEEEMKRRQNESKDGDMRPKEEGDQMGSELQITQATIEPDSHDRHDSDESMSIQQEESNTTSAIDEMVANESTIPNSIPKPIQHNQDQSTKLIESNPFQCDRCSASFKHRYLLLQHNRLHIDQPYACKFCYKLFDKFFALKSHEHEVHLKARQFRCDECGQEFSHKLILKAHRRAHCRPY